MQIKINFGATTSAVLHKFTLKKTDSHRNYPTSSTALRRDVHYRAAEKIEPIVFTNNDD